MVWKCPECGELNSDDSMIRCPCGYESSEDDFVKIEDEAPQTLLETYQRGDASSDVLHATKQGMIRHGLLSPSNWDVTFGWSRTQPDKFGFKGKGIVSVDDRYVELTAKKSASLLIKAICYVICALILLFVSGYLLDFILGSREIFYHGFASIFSIVLPSLFVGDICRFREIIFLKHSDITDISRFKNRIMFKGLRKLHQQTVCRFWLQTEENAEALERALQKASKSGEPT